MKNYRKPMVSSDEGHIKKKRDHSIVPAIALSGAMAVGRAVVLAVKGDNKGTRGLNSLAKVLP